MSLMAEYVIFRRRRACVCVAEWIPWFEKVLIKREVIYKNVDIAQLTGNAGASGGTHRQGGAMDFWANVRKWWVFLVVARQMGADASWLRLAWQGPWTKHYHCVLRGCRHNSPARYQLTEVDNNQDGLRGSRKDDGPRPLSKRTWREGIEWAKKELGAETLEDDMPSAREFWKEDIVPAPRGNEDTWEVASILHLLAKETLKQTELLEQLVANQKQP
jgi:hypothetical protein